MIEGIARGPGDCFEGRAETQGPYRGRDGADVSRTTVSRSRFVVPFDGGAAGAAIHRMAS
jgi:hypothetical protein